MTDAPTREALVEAMALNIGRSLKLKAQDSAGCDFMAEAALDTLCAARSDIAAVLSGEWVAVPREATQEMREVGDIKLFSAVTEWKKGGPMPSSCDVYTAMIAAAPEPEGDG